MDIYMIILIALLLILILGVIYVYIDQSKSNIEPDIEPDTEPDIEPDIEPDNKQIIPFYGIKNTSVSSGEINNDGWISENSYNDDGDFIITRTDPKYTITVGDKIYRGQWIQFELNCTKQTNYTIMTDNIEFTPCNIVVLVSDDGKEWIKYKEENKCVDTQEKIVFTDNQIIATYCKIIILNTKKRSNDNILRPVKINYIDITDCQGVQYFTCNHRTEKCEPTDLKTNFKNKLKCDQTCYLWNCNKDLGVCTEIFEGSQRVIGISGDDQENIECKNLCDNINFTDVIATEMPNCYYLMACGHNDYYSRKSGENICFPSQNISIRKCTDGTHFNGHFHGFDDNSSREVRRSNPHFTKSSGLYNGPQKITTTNNVVILGEWIGISTSSPVVVVRYKLQCKDNLFNSWVLVANNDEKFDAINGKWNSSDPDNNVSFNEKFDAIISKWNILDSRSNVSLYNNDGILENGMYKKDGMFTIDIENTIAYKNYLIVITSLKTGYIRFQLTYFNLYTL